MTPIPLHRQVSAAYRDAEVHTPVRQIVVLFDTAIRQLVEARAAIGEGRIEDRFHRICKVHQIVAALQSCLDFERGGEVAPVLDRLYGHILSRLTTINLRNDPAICDELAALLGRMREGWAAIADGRVDAAPTPARGAARPSAAVSA